MMSRDTISACPIASFEPLASGESGISVQGLASLHPTLSGGAYGHHRLLGRTYFVSQQILRCEAAWVATRIEALRDKVRRAGQTLKIQYQGKPADGRSIIKVLRAKQGGAVSS